MNPGSWAKRCLNPSASQSYYYLQLALLFLALYSINTNYHGDQNTCAMRYNRCHFIWMSRKFQGRKVAMKDLFKKLKRRQDWEALPSLIKRHQCAAWRESKTPLRNEMSTSCPDCQDSLTRSPGPGFFLFHCSGVGRKWLPGK
jgi:hypothetical protein